MEQEFRKRGWVVVVISKEDDITTEKGQKKAIDALKGPDDMLWHSQPCIGGVPLANREYKTGWGHS